MAINSSQLNYIKSPHDDEKKSGQSGKDGQETGVSNPAPVSTAPAPGPRQAEMSSVVTLLEKAWAIYKSNFWRFIGMMFVPILGFIPAIVIMILFGVVSYFGGNNLVVLFSKFVLGLAAILSILFLFVVAVIAQAGLVVLIKNAQTRPTIKEAFLEAKKMVWKFILVHLVMAVFVMLWTFLFIIPGIIMAIYFSMSVWVLFYEGVGGGGALKRSRDLIRGHWWGVFGRLLFIQIIIFGIIILPTLIVRDDTFLALWGIISQLISFASAPLVLAYSCYLYWDLRRIKGDNYSEHK